MATLILSIIYLTFISLGLPDSMLGAAWPVMQAGFQVPFDHAGLASMVVTGSTIGASLFSGRIIGRLGIGPVTLVSVALTAVALFGLSLAPSFAWVVLLGIPLGLGAGAVDSGLNGYVANHYKAHHMSWLHCFWGVGAMLGPLLLSRTIVQGYSWRTGYQLVSLIQFALVLMLFFSLGLWDRTGRHNASDTNPETINKTSMPHFFAPLQLPGMKLALATFLFYCGLESTVNLWGGSYLVHARGLDPATAANWVASFFAGITLGRLLAGFLSLKINNKGLIRFGSLLVLSGVLLLLAPLPVNFALLALILIGLGCAPIFPSMLHETPTNFGKDEAQQAMGFQMAAASVGATFLPPFFGFIAAQTNLALLPYFLLLCVLLMLVCSEGLSQNRPELAES